MKQAHLLTFVAFFLIVLPIFAQEDMDEVTSINSLPSEPVFAHVDTGSEGMEDAEGEGSTDLPSFSDETVFAHMVTVSEDLSVGLDLSAGEELTLSEALSPAETLAEEKEVIIYPISLTFSEGIFLKRYEGSEQIVDEATGHILIKGDADLKLGGFEIIDNYEKRFRLITNSLTNSTAMQVQGLMPVMGRLGVEIAGDVYPQEARYSGEMILDFSRMGLRHFLKLDWARMPFDYFYLRSEQIRLYQDFPGFKVSNFDVVPTNARFSKDGFIFSLVLKDPNQNFLVEVSDFQVMEGAVTSKSATCRVSFLGEQVIPATCQFEDRFCLVSFETEQFFNKTNRFMLELYPDGQIRFLDSFHLLSGEEILFNGRMPFREGAFHGQAEIQRASKRQIEAYLVVDDVRLYPDGVVKGVARLTRGQLVEFDPKDETFDLVIEEDGKLFFSNPVIVEDPEIFVSEQAVDLEDFQEEIIPEETGDEEEAIEVFSQEEVVLEKIKSEEERPVKESFDFEFSSLDVPDEKPQREVVIIPLRKDSTN